MESSYFNVKVPLKYGDCLVYNSATQQLLRLTAEELVKFDACLFDGPYDYLLLLLRSKGFVCKSALIQYQQLIDSDLSDKKLSSQSMSLTLMMTEGCNFSCSYCNQGLIKDPKKIDQQSISKVLSYVARHEDLKNLNLSWYGGEPLLVIADVLSFSSQFKEFCEKKAIQYLSTILTNGYLLTSDKADQLFGSGVKCAQVSMDGFATYHDNSRFPNKHTGSYEKILNNIANVLKNTGLSVVLRVNVNKHNIDSIPLLIDDIKNRDIPCDNFSMYFSLIYDPALSQLKDAGDVGSDIIFEYEQYAQIELELLQRLDSYNINVALDIDEHMGDCLVTRHNSFAINPYGELFKCYIPISNQDFKLGDVSDFDAAKKSDIFVKWNSWTAFNDEDCKRCRLLGSCRGGCPLHFVSTSHENLGPRCPTSKLRFNEHLFRRAVNSGLATKKDWDYNLSSTQISSLSFKYPSDNIRIPDFISLKCVNPT